MASLATACAEERLPSTTIAPLPGNVLEKDRQVLSALVELRPEFRIPPHELFEEGLSATGVAAARLRPICAIATTTALINFLFERASRTLVEYGSLFAVMQPPDNAAPGARVETYERLRRCYPFAQKIVDALERHDAIDLGAGHRSWALEQHLRRSPRVSADDMGRAYVTMRDAACFFIMFFDGIRDSYQIGTLAQWKQLANVAVDAALP